MAMEGQDFMPTDVIKIKSGPFLTPRPRFELGIKLLLSITYLKGKIVLLIFCTFMTSRQCVTAQRNVEVPLGLATLASVGGSSIAMLVRYMQAVREAEECNKNIKKQEAELQLVSEELAKNTDDCKRRIAKCDNEKEILNAAKTCLTDFANGIILDQKRTIEKLHEELQENKRNILANRNELQSHQRQILDLENTKSKISSTEAYVKGLQAKYGSMQSDINANRNELQSHQRQILDLENTKSKISSTEANVKDLQAKYGSMQSDINDMRKTVAFTAGMTSKVTSGLSVSTLVFPKVILNAGNGYDPGTGVFTAPVTGDYVFYVAAVSYDDEGIYLDIAVNGQSKVRSVGSMVGKFQTGTNLVVYRLQKGDRVWVKRYIGKGYWTYSNAPATTFSGFLLQ